MLKKFGLILATAVIMAAVLIAGTLVVIKLTNPPRLIAMFDGDAPGNVAATDAIDFAHDAKIDVIINYSVMNANPADVAEYLKYAKLAEVKIAVSLKDFLGPTDLDPANKAFHDLYGTTNDERVHNMVTALEQDPSRDAIWGYYISDELPENADDTSWYQPLQDRYDQVKKLTTRPVMVSTYRNPVDFLKTLMHGTDHLVMDYYPYPESEKYGKINDIPALAKDMREAAGNNSWFAIQAFSYYVNEPDMVAKFEFPNTPPDNSNKGAPTASQMVEMAQKALHDGVHNIAVFHYNYAKDIPGQLGEIQIAIRQIRDLPEFG